MKTAVLFIVFNRPDTTRLVFAAIRAARPPRLYVVADGPRGSHDDDASRCEEARKEATGVDWQCEVKTLFRDKNLGCKRSVSEGIGWFFQQEAEGIVIEDDVLPQPTFFPYCEELLERYRDDPRVLMIGGCNLVTGRLQMQESYFFSKYANIWGWASWRRAWRHYDSDIKEWPCWRDAGGLRRLSQGDRPFEAHWRRVFDTVCLGQIDTWDYQWLFACWRTSGCAVLPAVNLTKNIGFRADATHTNSHEPDYLRTALPSEMGFPLVHPLSVMPVQSIDSLIGKVVYGISRRSYLVSRIRRLPLIGVIAERVAKTLKAATR
jgi:GT2 family glycosyltransferase